MQGYAPQNHTLVSGAIMWISISFCAQTRTTTCMPIKNPSGCAIPLVSHHVVSLFSSHGQQIPSITMTIFDKFTTRITYAEWPNVIEAFVTCNGSSPIAKYGGRDEGCWNKLNCALEAADASQQAQYSSAATILGLVCPRTRQ